jgi:hypothetical protein
MYSGPTKFYLVAKAILDVVQPGLTNAVDRFSVVPGAIAWDECPCGLLAVSVGRIYLSDTFPAEIEQPVGMDCDPAYEVAEIIVQIVRCAPQPLGSGEISPTTAAQDTAAQIMAADTQEVLVLVSQWICDNRGTNISDGLVYGIDPQGPEGDCVGIELRAVIGLHRG